jgi:hypothetical protein
MGCVSRTEPPEHKCCDCFFLLLLSADSQAIEKKIFTFFGRRTVTAILCVLIYEYLPPRIYLFWYCTVGMNRIPYDAPPAQGSLP